MDNAVSRMSLVRCVVGAFDPLVAWRRLAFVFIDTFAVACGLQAHFPASAVHCYVSNYHTTLSRIKLSRTKLSHLYYRNTNFCNARRLSNFSGAPIHAHEGKHDHVMLRCDLEGFQALCLGLSGCVAIVRTECACAMISPLRHTVSFLHLRSEEVVALTKLQNSTIQETRMLIIKD